jgi:DNA-binding transcriptional ArsR family regulator
MSVRKSTSHPDPSAASVIDRTFSALSDATRRGMLSRLAESQGGLSVNELAEPFRGRMSLPAVSKHLRVLQEAGLVEQERDGRVRRCLFVAQPLQPVHDWLAYYRRFWSNQLDALAAFVEDAHAAEQQAVPGTPLPEVD